MMNLDDFPALREFGTQLDQVAARNTARGTATRHSRLVLAVGCGVLALVAAGVAITFDGGKPQFDLAQRAYAEASAPGIAHWLISIQAFHGTEPGVSQTEEGWASNGVTHTILTSGTGSGASRSERRIANGQETYRNADGRSQQGPAGHTDLEASLPGSDPFAAYRVAYEAGRLDKTAPNTFEVMPATPAAGGLVRLTYEINPDTAQPATLTEASSDGTFRVVVDFKLYEHLDDSDANRQLLDIGSPTR